MNPRGNVTKLALVGTAPKSIDVADSMLQLIGWYWAAVHRHNGLRRVRNGCPVAVARGGQHRRGFVLEERGRMPAGTVRMQCARTVIGVTTKLRTCSKVAKATGQGGRGRVQFSAVMLGRRCAGDGGFGCRPGRAEW